MDKNNLSQLKNIENYKYILLCTITIIVYAVLSAVSFFVETRNPGLNVYFATAQLVMDIWLIVLLLGIVKIMAKYGWGRINIIPKASVIIAIVGTCYVVVKELYNLF
ncbi:hypothetical protein [Priestia aryabhattai]